MKRKTGILMHISSLPGKYGIGDLGHEAVRFADLLRRARAGAWQMLPLVPTDAAVAHSPYSSASAFAGNTLLISPDLLAEAGLVDAAALRCCEIPASGRVDFGRVGIAKRRLLDLAYDNFRRNDRDRFKPLSDAFWDFCVSSAHWLEDFALYTVLKARAGGVGWNAWRPAWRDRDWRVLDSLKSEPETARSLDRCRFEQFLFYRQLAALRAVCAERGIELVGDLPIYVAYDSADVWGRRDLFLLDADGAPSSVAGVPPDYFSKTGQRWGNPLYDWHRMRRDGYAWWVGRCGHALTWFDRVRIDHFRGLVAYWAIPAEEETAVAGSWEAGPGTALLGALSRAFAGGCGGELPFIAEDLGVRTAEVDAAMAEFGLPGMKVLQFAFGPDLPQNPYAPHNYERNCAVYVGTHDNNTAKGWWETDATETERANLAVYAGQAIPDADAAVGELMRLALASTGDLAVLAAQDVLRLGEETRMNTPSTTAGNWLWRMEGFEAFARRADEIAAVSALYGRGGAEEMKEGSQCSSSG